MTVTIQTMQQEDTGFCTEQARGEGWNPGVHDMDVFFPTDPAGWFKAVDGRGRILGCISAVAYDEHFGFIGFFVVRPEHRGGRVGIHLGMQALERLGNRMIGQDGVFAKVPNYQTWGFELAYRNLRYEWDAAGPLPPHHNIEIEPCGLERLGDLLDFERDLFPARREEFLRRWLAMPESKVRMAMDGGELTGYAVRRRCTVGYKVGPLFARNEVVARALFRSMLLDLPVPGPVWLDVPEVNRPAVAMVEGLGMKPCFGTARMYRNGRPDLDVGRIFGVTSFELG